MEQQVVAVSSNYDWVTFWSAAGAIGQWLGAIATFLAVWVALNQAKEARSDIRRALDAQHVQVMPGIDVEAMFGVVSVGPFQGMSVTLENHIYISNEGPGTALDVKVEVRPIGQSRLTSGEPIMSHRKATFGIDSAPIEIVLLWNTGSEPNYSANITVEYKGIFGAQYKRYYLLRCSGESLHLDYVDDKTRVVTPNPPM